MRMAASIYYIVKEERNRMFVDLNLNLAVGANGHRKEQLIYT